MVQIHCEKSPITVTVRDVRQETPVYVPEYGVVVTEAADRRPYTRIAGALRAKKLKSGLQLPPLFTYTGIVCYLMEGSLMALDNAGKTVWTKKTAQPAMSMEIQNDILFVVQKDNVIYGYDLAAGKEIWKYALSKDASSSDSLFTIYYLE